MGDWSGVIDLDYHNPDLWAYQIESLKFWAGIVDGFRCDVASFVPLEFWKAARKAVSEVRPEAIWLAETVHQSFGCLARYKGVRSELDYDMYEAFDMEYEYDIREAFDKYLQGKIVLSHYLDMLNFQEAIYPANYNKLRFLENHDQPRICSYVTDEQALRNYTAMLYFLKGTTLLYAGQEFENDHLPSLFEKEPIDRQTGKDLTPLLKALASIKRALGVPGYFRAEADDANDIAVMQRAGDTGHFIGVFSLKGVSAEVPVPAMDGVYENLLDGTSVTVADGTLSCAGEPVIIRAPERD